MREISVITSSSNKIVKEIKKLYSKKHRWESEEFFIEGLRSVRQCLESNTCIKYVVYSEELLRDEGREFLLELKTREVQLFSVTKSIFESVSDTDSPQGLLAVVKIEKRELEEVLRIDNFLILLDKVQDPGNLGTIIRTADAFGANAVIVTSGCVDVYNPKTVRSTMGSIFQIPIVYISDTVDAVGLLKKHNIKVISSSLDTESYSFDIDFKKDCALVVGNEANGISSEVLEISDELVKIKMVGKAESLNAGIASGVLMYEVLRQRTHL